MSSYCCEDMRVQIELDCDIHDDPMDCPDCLVVYLPKTEEYGLPVRDGGSSYVVIGFCPWCGSKLPTRNAGRRMIDL